MIESLRLSCYLQGCHDALQLIEQRPDFIAEWHEMPAQLGRS